jgi:GTP-binding protein
MGNIVAIVGRPNVGKSTFFNRLVEKREAIMDNEPGVTRDRHYGYAEWCGKFFTVIDTGGYVTGSEDKFESQIRKQVKLAIDEATAIVFMVDCKDGMTGFDKEFANILRTSKKPIFVAANKADTPSKAVLERTPGENGGLTARNRPIDHSARHGIEKRQPCRAGFFDHVVAIFQGQSFKFQG